MITSTFSDEPTSSQLSFIPGLQLCEHFYWQVVRPILDAEFPGLAHAAALLGSGSEVLGYDDAMSTDHHYGPRVLLFLHDDEQRSSAQAIHQALATHLPYHFLGFSTNFSEPDPNDNGTQVLTEIDSGPVNHRVSLHTLQSFFIEQLSFDLSQPLEAADWLTFSQQHLLAVTAGRVYHDDLGLNQVRERFAFYPHDVWLYLLAAGWARIGQEEHLMGRAGLVGDEIGSALIGARLVRDIMRLCFLMERRYAPYPKWFGTAFKRLACAGDLQPVLTHALHAQSWQERQQWLVNAYQQIAALHNALGVTEPLPEEARNFFGRPFQVIALHGFESALLAQIRDRSMLPIAERRPIGSIDQFSDSTDLLEDTARSSLLKCLY